MLNTYIFFKYKLADGSVFGVYVLSQQKINLNMCVCLPFRNGSLSKKAQFYHKTLLETHHKTLHKSQRRHTVNPAVVGFVIKVQEQIPDKKLTVSCCLWIHKYLINPSVTSWFLILIVTE